MFRVINYGKDTDELKFIFIPAGMSSGFTYTEHEDIFTKADIVGLYAEITYHNDGLLLHKFPSAQKNEKPQYKNPSGLGNRRTPISKVRAWEPFAQYTIVDYSACKIIVAENAVIVPNNATIFNGAPFICTLFLGHMTYADPPNNQLTEMIYRINDVASSVDLILWFYKTDYQGRLMQINNTNLVIETKNNLVNIIEKIE